MMAKIRRFYNTKGALISLLDLILLSLTGSITSVSILLGLGITQKYIFLTFSVLTAAVSNIFLYKKMGLEIYDRASIIYASLVSLAFLFLVIL
jgi:hypothetical protein